MNRYEDEKFDLDLKERSGWRFIACARGIYLQLANLHETKHVKLGPEFQKIVPVLDELYKIWGAEEDLRDKCMVPKYMRDDYKFAKDRHQRMTAGPDRFYKEDGEKRKQLEQEKYILANKIKKFEIDFSREEDTRRLEIMDQRVQISGELAVLKYEKEKYEGKSKSILAMCLPMLYKKDDRKLAAVNEKIKVIEEKLAKLGPLTSKSLEEKRYTLDLLYKRRWDVEKTLNAHDDSAITRVKRWQNAIDNAEVVLVVRRMDIDDAINRFYAAMSSQVIHAMLNAYALIKMTVDGSGAAFALEAEMKEFAEIADMMYCPEIASRSVLTLYKKIQALKEEDRHQIIHQKPQKNHLPEALIKTFSVKNLKAAANSLGLFRKVIDNPQSVDDTEQKKVNEVVVSPK